MAFQYLNRKIIYTDNNKLYNLSKIILLLMITDNADNINIPSDYGDTFYTFEKIKFVSPFYGGNKNILIPEFR